jgi:hypothetical protein
MYLDATLGRMVAQAYRGRYYRPKVGGISWSFSLSMLEVAGGWRKFLDEWEEDPTV